MKNRCIFFSLSLVIMFTSVFVEAQWNPTNLSVPYLSAGIDGVDETTAWAGGIPFSGPSAILRTTNGGESWDTKDFPSSSSQWPFCIYAVDSSTVFVGTWNTSGIEPTAYVFRSQDGGDTWDTMDLGNVVSPIIAGIHFYNPEEGFILVNITGFSERLVFFETKDGGDTWVKNNLFPAQAGEFMYLYNNNSCYEVRDNYIWVGTLSGRIMRSKDRGNTWDTINWPLYNQRDVTSIAFKDTLSGLAIFSTNVSGFGMNGNTEIRRGFSTQDSGETWEEVSVPNDIETVEYITGTDNMYLGTEGYTNKPFYYISKDGGFTWHEKNIAGLIDVDIMSDTMAWGVGISAEAGPGVVKWENTSFSEIPFSENLQEVPYFEGFEDGLPNGYEFGGYFDLSSNGRTEQFASIGVTSEDEFAGVVSLNPWWTYTFIHTAPIYLAEGQNYQLSFDAFFPNVDAPIANERAYISISLDNKQSWTEIYELEEEGIVEWLEHTLDLSSFSGQTIHLAFNYKDPSIGSAFGFFIDNIAVNTVTSTKEIAFKLASCYPNPATTFITVETVEPTQQNAFANIYTTSGQFVKRVDLDGPYKTSFSIETLPVAQYFLEINNDGKISHMPFSKQ